MCVLTDMLKPLEQLCMNCSMCLLGRTKHEARGQEIKPHVFSNMKPSLCMVVGQNPGFNECIQGEPFVGQAGDNFNKALEANGLKREQLYISNCVKCHTPNNRAPTDKEVETCSAILKMEIAILKPRMVVTLGASAFGSMCPGLKYADSLGDLVQSERFGVWVMPIYHPSPRNLANKERNAAFHAQVARMASLFKALLDLEKKAAASTGIAED